MDRYRHLRTPENFALVERLRPFAGARDLTLAQVALGWLMSRPEVPTVPAGAMNPDQLASNLGAVEWRPTSGDLAELGQIADNPSPSSGR